MKLTLAQVFLTLVWLRCTHCAPTINLPLGLDLPTGDFSAASQASTATLPFARRVSTSGSASVVKFDQARAQSFRDRAAGKFEGVGSATQAASVFNVPVTAQVVSYVAEVQIGDPPTNYSLLIDTGSSNTWVGANLTHPYKMSLSTMPTQNAVCVTYGSGSFMGMEVTDQITLAPGLTIKCQGIGAAVAAEGFDNVDGILGIGPTDLTCGSLFPGQDKCIPTVVDNAYQQGLLEAYEIGISFAPSSTPSEMNGELTFGGVDESKYQGNLSYVPITSTSPASKYVGIDQSVMYGDVEILPPTAGIVDTGTTLLLLASDAFNAYQNMTGATMDEDSGLLTISEEQYESLQSMFFNIGGTTYELTPDAQLWPRSLNANIGGKPDGYYLIVSNNGAVSGAGLDFINGMAWLERFYTVYDVGNSRVGLAPTIHTSSVKNVRTQ